MSYSPVRGFYDQVVARYHQTGRYNDETVRFMGTGKSHEWSHGRAKEAGDGF